MNNKKIKVLSLFSGIGAFEKALSNIGIDYDLVGFCEIDKYAIESYCAIHNTSIDKNLGDISKADLETLKDMNIDLIVGGSPCQDFSAAGKQKGSTWTCNDCNYEFNPLTVNYATRTHCPNCNNNNLSKTRSSLVIEMLRVIRETKPKYVIYENVKNIVGKNFKSTFDLFVKELEDYGYCVYWKVLNAKDYDLPQNRERVFVVCVKKEIDFSFEFPAPKELKTKLKDLLQDDSEIDEINYLSYNLYKCLSDMTVRGNGFVRGNSFKPITKDKDYVRCITTRSGNRANDNFIIGNYGPTKLRKLTPLECFRLMGFNDNDYYKCVEIGISRTQIIKQAGNSIAVNVLENIFTNLFIDLINTNS